jgi:hypothetical protein
VIARKQTLVLPQAAFRRLYTHLFPGDGLEAAALLLCSAVEGRRRKLLARDLIKVPYDACTRRTPDSLTWPGAYVETAIGRAEAEGLVVIAVHSHPGGLFEFSHLDDTSDQLLAPALHQGTGREAGSAIMDPSGALRGRLYKTEGTLVPIDLVMVAGDDLTFWWAAGATAQGPSKRPMAFTSGMTSWLGALSACVIGVSGTGSIVAEQLARLGFGEIILIDFDKIEERNLNRILNSTLADAAAGRLKVEMFAAAVKRFRPNCDLVSVPASIATRDGILAACDTDVLFSCVDTAEGRHLVDRMSAYFAMPLFDVGVSIPTRKGGSEGQEIAEVCGRIDYVFPGGSSLLDRGVYDSATLEAEYLARAAPDAHRRRLDDGYLRGIEEKAPAVITLNMRAAADCVMEFVARAFPFRHGPNASRARTLFMLADGDQDFVAEHEFPASATQSVSAGLLEPLLGLPALAKRRQAA